jgi:hypothetical protein
MICMRLSLRRAARVAVASSAKQEIRARSSGRDDKGRVVAYLNNCDWDVWSSGGENSGETGRNP